MKRTVTSILLMLAGLTACQNKSNTGKSNSGISSGDTLSYRYDSVKVYSKIPVSENAEVGDTTKATFVFPVFGDSQLNMLVEKNALSSDNPDAPAYSSYEDMATKFIGDFDAFKKENEDSFQSWFKIVKIKVLPQWENYLGLEYTFFEYLGGAHPNTGVVYRNYNLRGRKPLTLDDIIQPGKKDELTAIAEKIFRKNEGLSDSADLGDNYFFDKGIFALNDNFYLSDDGINFLYNAYEIKAYVHGRTKLSIPYSSIKHILAENPVLSRHRK